MIIIKNATIYKENGTFETGDIIIKEEHIIGVEPDGFIEQGFYKKSVLPDDGDLVIDATSLYAIPGLTDIHFHGCAGYDFCDGTTIALDAITTYEATQGVTTICPATMSLPEATLSNICKNAADYRNEKGSILSGIHMEGPFLSVKKKGAQNEAYLRKPDIKLFHRLNNQCNQLFKIVSIAPEETGAMDFISNMKDIVVVSIAHTTADYSLSLQAFSRGACHVTHLYNAMPSFHHRDPGVVGAAFDSTPTTVELICDGILLHPSIIWASP